MSEIYNAYFMDGSYSSLTQKRTRVLQFNSREEKDDFIRNHGLKFMTKGVWAYRGDEYNRVRIGDGPALTVDGLRLERFVERSFGWELMCDLIHIRHNVYEFTQYSDYEVYLTSDNYYLAKNYDEFNVLLENTPPENIKRTKSR